MVHERDARETGRLGLPPDDPHYSLRRIWLTKEQEAGYYYGFANEGLWPLCHLVHTRPQFRPEDWAHYTAVNEKFAAAVLEEVAGVEAPLILIQDYHFALLPALIKRERPDARVAIFWHIPWPNPEAFGICPWRDELLNGLLGSSILGFHTRFHCNNFLEGVDRFMESRIDRERNSVTLAGLVLMLGMAVDANVLIYERLREERERGASLALAIRNGYDRAFPTIIDTHLSSIFTAIVLFGNYSASFATFVRISPRQVGLLVALWVATSLLYPVVRSASAWFVDTIVLRRADYATLRADITRHIQTQQDVPSLLSDVCQMLQPALSAREVTWDEWDGTDQQRDGTVIVAGGRRAIALVETSDPPAFRIHVDDLAVEVGQRA
jgi:hypothetical protein